MKHLKIAAETGFKVVAGTGRSQAAMMTLDPGTATGGPDNRHPHSDQWLFVLAGTGTAAVEGTQVPLGLGTLLLIEAGEAHEIANTDKQRLEILSISAPPAYAGWEEAAWIEEVRHETEDAALVVQSVAGEEDPGAAAEDIVEDLAEHEKEMRGKK